MTKCCNFSVLIVVFALFGCKEESPANRTIESLANLEVDSGIDSDEISNDTLPSISWTFYEGRLGGHRQHFVLELGISETNRVSGRYFFSRQQEFHELNGIVDTLSDTLRLRETFQGKITGYFTLFNSDGNLQGYRTDSEGNEVEKIAGREVKLTFEKRNRLAVIFKKFERKKKVDVHENLSKQSKMEEAVDELMINSIDDKHFSFYYYVVGKSRHEGSIEGIATIVEKDYAIYQVPDNHCLISFRFYKDSISIEEENNCSSFRGDEASFTNTLTKVR